MNLHASNCNKNVHGWADDCTCKPGPDGLYDWERELLTGEKPNPHDKIHERIAALGRERDAGLRMVGSLTVDGKDTAVAVAGVKRINARIEELRNVLGWL